MAQFGIMRAMTPLNPRARGQYPRKLSQLDNLEYRALD